jgi:HK97 family phage major capsid protein
MKLFKFPLLLAALVMLALVVGLLAAGVTSFSNGLLLLGAFQLVMLCLDQPRGALFMAALSHAQVEEFSGILEHIETKVRDLPNRLERLERENDELRGQLRGLRKSALMGGGGGGGGVRWIGNKGFVSDDCARALTGVFVLDCAKIKNGLESMIPDVQSRERILSAAAAAVGVEVKTALSGTEIPLPVVYAPQIMELVFKYGQARQFATVFPLGAGSVKLPRLKAGEDDFGYFGAGTAGMSQSITEKRVTAEVVTFTANKAGGLVRIPYELEEDTFVPIGQFLARYIARQLAKLEDKTLFLGDGTATYASQTGVGPYCAANSTYLLQQASGKTKPSDATLADFRNLRAKVSAALLTGGFDAAYYLNPTWEPALRGFNTYPNFVVFENVNGQPKLDGWPVRWVGVLQPYSTSAAASTFSAFFGDLTYWFLGERGAPRVEVSRDVFFATDELAMRALERIDVECLGIDAMGALQTAAS